MFTSTAHPHRHRLVRRSLTSFIAAFTAAAGFASSSCAAPRWPAAGSPLRSHVGGYELQVLIDGALTRSYEYGGETHVLGSLGARYTLRVVNRTGRRIEAVVSVDGRDAIDGKSADVRNKRGYLVPAWGVVDIEGWRLSRAEVAAFRFSNVGDSYAARTGNAREVGVIGVAVFPERSLPPRVYAPPPRLPDPEPPYDWYRRPSARDERGWGSAPQRDSDKSDTQPAPEAMSGTGSSGNAEGAAAARPRAAAAAGSAASPKAKRSADTLAESESSRGPAPHRRPGLGTEFGEAMTSPVREVTFVRANAGSPTVVLGARYNDRDGLLALGIDVDGSYGADDDLAWRQSATPFPASTDHRYATPPGGWQPGCCLRY